MPCHCIRLCVDPEFATGNIIYRVFEHIYFILVTSGRNFIVTSTDQSMWRMFYEKMGFRKTGVHYKHPSLNKIRHDLILVHKDTGIKGKGVSPQNWFLFYRSMTDHMVKMDIIKHSAWIQIKLGAFTLITRTKSALKKLSGEH